MDRKMEEGEVPEPLKRKKKKEDDGLASCLFLLLWMTVPGLKLTGMIDWSWFPTIFLVMFFFPAILLLAFFLVGVSVIAFAPLLMVIFAPVYLLGLLLKFAWEEIKTEIQKEDGNPRNGQEEQAQPIGKKEEVGGFSLLVCCLPFLVFPILKLTKVIDWGWWTLVVVALYSAGFLGIFFDPPGKSEEPV